jgi:hypothetical protein
MTPHKTKKEQMKRLALTVTVILSFFTQPLLSQDAVGLWKRWEKEFASAKEYDNPLYDVHFSARFVSPTGKIKNIRGFWDGGRSWKVRFMPDEKGVWQWATTSTDKSNAGLQGQTGSFTTLDAEGTTDIYRKGAITRRPGLYHLEHADGTPFFWTACTAWNGTLKSTDQEWEYYLSHRARNNYSVIQFVTTQWRGGDKNSLGQVAFEGSGLIRINPEFFQHLDKKIDQINAAGLVAAPVLLWALPTSKGRYLSPGYFLPEEEAILLARYMVARYGGNHVVWILGGDGRYLNQYEQRWTNIGRGVFGDEHPGLVALHPSGRDWIGDVYAKEEWLDIVGFQTGHNNADETLSWITKGPVVKRWDKIPPKVLINMEPVYEEISAKVSADDVRRASYWSLLSCPTSGITYGANGIWPWLREGEEILNHAGKGEAATRVLQALDLPGSLQIGYLASQFRRLDWWKLKPAPELLLVQPGDQVVQNFISVSRTDDRRTVVAFVPGGQEVTLRNPGNDRYLGEWFDPVVNKRAKAPVTFKDGLLIVSAARPGSDYLLILNRVAEGKK